MITMPALRRPRPTPDDEVGLILARMAGELRALAVLGDTLQDALGGVIAAGGAPTIASAEMLHALQNIDLLTQSLDALAVFTRRLGAACPSEARVDASAALDLVPLAGLAARLAGDTTSEPDDLAFDLF